MLKITLEVTTGIHEDRCTGRVRRGDNMSEREQLELKRDLARAYMAEARRRCVEEHTAPPGYLEKSLALLSEEPPTLKPQPPSTAEPEWLQSP